MKTVRDLKIATLGAGYVGLVTGVCFSDFGYSVTCVDKDIRKIDQLIAGEMPIFQDERIGSKYLAPGPGYGGSCFPKDTRALLDIAKKAGVPSRIVEQVIHVNDARKQSMADKVIALCGGSVKGLTVAMLGLAFKPDTDDVRETPAFPIIEALQKAGANIRAFDPEAMDESKDQLSDVTYAQDAYDCARGADVIVLATEWAQFHNLDFNYLGEIMTARRFADLRNVYAPEDVRSHGFDYVSVGRA